jgi:PAS domain S-box-containing protein
MSTSLDVADHPARILIVDDERLNRELLEVMLTPEGYQLVSASSGEEALAMVTQQAPDLILLDVMMPGTDGYDVAGKIKGNPATKNIPIIMVTALEDRKARLLGLAAGAEDFLNKPVDHAELCVRVRNLLRLKDYGDDQAEYGRLLESEVASRTAELVERTKELERNIEELERAHAENARLAAIVGSSHVAIIGKALDGTVTSWNRGAERTYGYTAAEMIGQPISRIIPSESTRETAEISGRILRGEWMESIETERIRKDGKRILVSLSNSPVLDSADRIVGVATIAHDVTERRAAEASVRQHENLLDALFNASPVGIAIFDPALRFLKINRSLAEMNGATIEEHWGRSLGEIVPDLATGVETHLERVLETGEPIQSVEISGETPREPGVPRHWAVSYFPIPDGSGQTVALGTVVVDVTEIKESAARLSHALVRAQESDRLKTAFLSNMSHEVRTPLNVILGHNALIAEQLAELHDETLISSVEAVRTGCMRLLQTIHGVLDLSRFETETFVARPKLLRLGPVVEDIVGRLRTAAEKKNLSLSCEIDAPKAEVVIDEYCLEQSLLLLLGNAVKFTKQGGVTVRLHRDPTGIPCLTVRDTGIGIDAKYVPDLFKPFSQQESGYTRRFEGPGIGLALVKRYLALNRAEIDLRSEKEQGTTVTIRFPPFAGNGVGHPSTGPLP